ncbi:MAG TPA: RtcB family protein [Candidatus Babeliales bacterium]|nr:RtcB family protein [Candidatus Babeliales bacterium]
MADTKITREQLKKITESIYEIAQSYRPDMKVPVRVFMNEAMMEDVLSDRALDQLVNVATLPGIQTAAFGMPDIHQGYGFPIGGVAGMDINAGGVISPGGIGYDINCGVRLLSVSLTAQEIAPYLEKLATRLFHKIPSGVGRGGALDFNQEDIDAILKQGAPRMLELGYGTFEDIALCEEQGHMIEADPFLISKTAKERGRDQIGTLGSGNHFLEVQVVEQLYNEGIAQTFGLEKDMVTVMIHCGSRGLGHQTCTDYVRMMMKKLPEWGYKLPDRELIYAPFRSPEGQAYFKGMAAAANYAWANRHMITHWVREAFQEIIGSQAVVSMVYDISHNLGKVEKHMVHGSEKELVLHRKGATRAFGPGRKEVAEKYRAVGQPVLIPGTMGTSSYVLAGTEQSMQVAFGSSCHGAGRRLSRSQAKKEVRGSQLRQELQKRGIIIRSDSDVGLAEEAPLAYKDIDTVVNVVHDAGLAKKVARVRPIAVIKGG